MAGSPTRPNRLERRTRALPRLLALALLAMPLAGCDTLGGLFGKSEEYLPDEPADKLYNEGLYLLNRSATPRPRPRNSRKSTASIPIRNGRARRC